MKRAPESDRFDESRLQEFTHNSYSGQLDCSGRVSGDAPGENSSSETCGAETVGQASRCGAATRPWQRRACDPPRCSSTAHVSRGIASHRVRNGAHLQVQHL